MQLNIIVPIVAQVPRDLDTLRTADCIIGALLFSRCVFSLAVGAFDAGGALFPGWCVLPPL